MSNVKQKRKQHLIIADFSKILKTVVIISCVKTFVKNENFRKPDGDGSDTTVKFCAGTVGLMISLLMGDISILRIAGKRGEALKERTTVI